MTDIELKEIFDDIDFIAWFHEISQASRRVATEDDIKDFNLLYQLISEHCELLTDENETPLAGIANSVAIKTEDGRSITIAYTITVEKPSAIPV